MPKFEGVYKATNGTWYFKVRVAQDPLTKEWRQVTRRGFATALDASQARRDALEADVPVSVDVGSMTVNQLIERYFADAETSGALSAKTLHHYRDYLNFYIAPYLGERSVREVTPEMLATWQHRLAKSGSKSKGPLSPNSIRLARAPLAGAFKYAVRLGHVRRSPMDNVPRPKQQRSVVGHWSPDEARTFLMWQQEDRLYPLWAFLLGSGLRIGELVWLSWKDVDLDRGLVRIVQFATALGYELAPSVGKSADAVRTIELDPHLVAVLQRQRAQQKAEAKANGYLISGYVFTKEGGGSFHPQYLSRQLGKLSVEAGLPRLTAHGLRHTSATLMLASGVPAKVAAERLGHSDPALFTNVYSHVTQTMQKDAATKIGAALFG
jgi:integrase